MDDLRQSVQGAVYEQKDPLLIYKFEAFELFKQMVDKSNKEIASFLFKGQLPSRDAQVQEAKAPKRTDMDKLQTSHEQLAASGGGSSNEPNERPKAQPVVKDKSKSYGRNDVVTVQNLTTGEKKELKYKKAQPLVDSNQWMIVE